MNRSHGSKYHEVEENTNPRIDIRKMFNIDLKIWGEKSIDIPPFFESNISLAIGQSSVESENHITYIVISVHLSKELVELRIWYG